jgi:hypothetical protein
LGSAFLQKGGERRSFLKKASPKTFIPKSLSVAEQVADIVAEMLEGGVGGAVATVTFF